MLIKPKKDIDKIMEGGKIIGKILEELAGMCKSGVNTKTIDDRAEKLILEVGGKPAFKWYKSRKNEPPFPTTICASVNDGLVHGIAREDLVLKNGDIFSIDIGMEYKKCFTDTALTVIIGSVPDKTKKLLYTTQGALEHAINVIKPGMSIAELGGEIEDYILSEGKYGIVQDLVGHGVGHAVHEEPRVPNFYDERLEKFILKEGMVIAIEPMISLGGYRIKTAKDGWTIAMADGSLCAHFEHTVIITKNGCEVATRRPKE